MTEGRLHIDFFLGLGSRYSYLAATQLARIECQYGTSFRWKPVASGALMGKRGANPFHGPPQSGQYDWAYREYDARCWADYYRVPFREPAAFRKDPAILPLVCLAADRQGALVEACRMVQSMIFVEGRVIDDDAIADVPRLLRLDETAFHAALSAPETSARHEEFLGEAHARGAFGVPTFFVGERMFWGNDRLVLLEAELRKVIGS